MLNDMRNTNQQKKNRIKMKNNKKTQRRINNKNIQTNTNMIL